MSNDDIQRDLAQLRKEIAALSASRKESAETPTPPAPSPQAAPSPTTAEEGAAPPSGAPEGAESEHSQLNELLELLETEIKDLPAITCLIIFSLGILMGRFLR